MPNLVEEYNLNSKTNKYVSPSFGSPDVEFEYRVDDIQNLKLRIPKPEHERIFAHRQWKGGIHLADRLRNGDINVEDKFVLEVGAGTGLSGLVASRKRAKFVLITDYNDDSLIKNLRNNIKLNIDDSNNNNTVKCQPHTWGKDMDDLQFYNQGYEVILAADVIWDSFSHVMLIESLIQLLAKKSTSRVILVAGYHTGRHVVQAFLRRARAKGLVPLNDAILEFERGEYKHTYTSNDFELLDGMVNYDEHREDRQKLLIETHLVWTC